MTIIEKIEDARDVKDMDALRCDVVQEKNPAILKMWQDKYWRVRCCPLTIPCDLVVKAKSDCLTLALRLHGEDPETFSPETREVMDRWKEKIEAKLRGDL